MPDATTILSSLADNRLLGSKTAISIEPIQTFAQRHEVMQLLESSSDWGEHAASPASNSRRRREPAGCLI
jgi:hypothetical protein